MYHVYKRKLWPALAGLALSIVMLALSLFLLKAHPLQAQSSPASAHRIELSVIKHPNVTTTFVVTNTTGDVAQTLHRYYTFLDPTTPVCTETHQLAANASPVYSVGTVSCLPPIFYGRLSILSDQPLAAHVIAPHKLIMGNVHYADRSPVTDGRVIAHRQGSTGYLEVPTDPQGDYIIPVEGGRWLLEVAPARGVTQTDWIYVDRPQEAIFTKPPEVREVQVVPLQVLTATGYLIGQVRLPGQASLAGWGAQIIARNSQGIGNETLADPRGFFDLQVPRGVYNVYVRPLSATLGGPSFYGTVITEATHLGRISLYRATAVITGQVTAGAGNPLNSIPGIEGPAHVIAWERQGRGWGTTCTGARGYYTLPLVAGRLPNQWVVRVIPPRVTPPDAPLVAPLARSVMLRAGAQRALNFQLLPADGHIIGQAVNPDGNPLNVLGRAHALRQQRDIWPRHFYAPVYRGAFTLTVPTTHVEDFSYDVAVRPEPASGFAPGYRRDVNPPTSGDTYITVTLHPRNALVTGALVDVQGGLTPTKVVTGVKAQVFAINRPPDALAGDWQSRWVDPHTGQYRMGVVSDTWWVDFRVEKPQLSGWIPAPRFRHTPHLHLHTVTAHEVVMVPLPVIPLNHWISGTVSIAPPPPHTKLPVPYIKVCARGIDPENKGIRLCTETNRQGRYRLRLATGHYAVRVLLPQSLRDRDYLEPDAEIISPTEDKADFLIQKANARLEGEAIIEASGPISEVLAESPPTMLLWGWSMGGSQVYTEVALLEDPQNSGVFVPRVNYSLGVSGKPGGETWFFGAAYQSGGVLYRAPRQKRVIHPFEVVTLTLRLASLEDLLGRLPEPQSIVFDRSLGVTLVLSNGVTLRIPAGAIPADTDEVALDIYPRGLLPHQRFEEVLGFGYVVAAYDGNGVPIKARFYEEVALTMPYNPALLPPGVGEEDILPAYLSTTTGRWELPENYVVDTSADQVTLFIDHFTDFALLSTPFTGSQVYLPLVLRE